MFKTELSYFLTGKIMSELEINNTGENSNFISPTDSTLDMVCLSHLRWDFVYQRPQHLLSRFAKNGRVFFIEEPVFTNDAAALSISKRENGLHVIVPNLPHGLSEDEIDLAMRGLITQLFTDNNVNNFFLWYYTPMMLAWVEHLNPLATVYDCMDELSAFKGAPTKLKDREKELFSRADLVFTGGQSLYEAKREQHTRVYAFPSSIDVNHFAQALENKTEPEDQKGIPQPRIGFFGVIDERTDINLLREIAELKPDWHFVMIGPVVKIDPAELPQGENIHYLGGKQYAELPSYIAGWDVAMMPFALNDSTKFISPTKTPEYLAAGRPVVSTPIRDVVRPYGENGLAHIAETAGEFVVAIEKAMNENGDERRNKADEFLANTSWDKTWQQMNDLINEVVETRKNTTAAESQSAVA